MDMFGRFAYADSEEKAEGGSPLDPADAKRVAGAGEAEPEPDASLLPSGPAAEAIAANADVKLHRKTNYVRRRMKRLRKKHLFDGKKASRRGKAPKGKVIDGEHELYALTYGMMLGLRTSLVHVYHSWRKPGILHMDDFNAKFSLPFPPSGSELTAPHDLNHTFKFKDYAPHAFAAIRAHFGVDTPSYVRSLCSQFSFIEFIANSRSGQFFFYSADGKYMIKTQTKEECTFLRRILPHYYRHVIQNPATMLTRFYGMHRVKMHHIRRKMRFVVMGSVFATREDVKCMFDVKGSTVGRFAKPGERVLKDCDLHRMGPDGAPLKLRLGHGRREHFLMQAKHDASFLAEHHIMDYSLLLGIVTPDELPVPNGVASPTPRHASSMEPELGADDDAARRGGDGDDGLGEHVADAAAVAAAVSAPPSGVEGLAADVAGITIDVDSMRLVNLAKGTDDEEEDDDDSDDSGDDAAPRASDDASSFASPSRPLRAEDDVLTSEGEYDSDFARADMTRNPRVRNRSTTHLFKTEKVRTFAEIVGPVVAADGRVPEEQEHTVGQGWMPLLSERDDGGIHGVDEHGAPTDDVYFMGIIDILQQYNLRKQAETTVKSLMPGQNVSQISCVPPAQYRDRFLQFLSDHTM